MGVKRVGERDLDDQKRALQKKREQECDQKGEGQEHQDHQKQEKEVGGILCPWGLPKVLSWSHLQHEASVHAFQTRI